MKKKIANALELLLLVVSFVIMNLNIVATPYGKVSLMDCISEFTFLYIPMLVLFGICAVICLISVISKSTEKDGLLHIAFPVLLFVSVFCNVSVSTNENLFELYTNELAVLFAILCAVVVVALAKRSSAIVSSEKKVSVQKTVINNIKENTNADELKKYKDLLDSGAITQEEFNAKKKQLLGL